MRIGIYARVSTQRQAQADGLTQQLDRLHAHALRQGWTVQAEHVFRDDGYSGASLKRPGLERLRDRAALRELDRVLITAPDRLARNYVHQVLLLEEITATGCAVEFLDRPMSQDPHDQLLLQIRGAVAEYERSLIAERMRRGRLRKLQAGVLLPWTRPPYGYGLDPDRPRDPAGVRLDPARAAVVSEMFAWYAEAGCSLFGLAKKLHRERVSPPHGPGRWNVTTVRRILTNPVYTGTVYAGRVQEAHGTGRRMARARQPRPVACGRGRTGLRSRPSPPLSARSSSTACRTRSLRTGNSPAATTPLTRIFCAPWSAVACVGSRVWAAACPRATATTAVAASSRLFTHTGRQRAPPATFQPSRWTRWSGRICAGC
jgi:DNA invertase Pin-like site-specific DNA recombinase